MAGEPFSGHVPKLSINFKEILLCPHGNSEEKNKVLEPSIIIKLLLLLHIKIILYNPFIE